MREAYPTVASGHPDAPILSVLGAYLRNGFLHRAIREQGGAYGGGASHDSNVGAFRFFSYRDPRTLDTFNDFDASIEWLLSEPANSDAPSKQSSVSSRAWINLPRRQVR